ncbi:hypothetical protein LINPERHAP1_LOCUS38898 [Linum perenne]
MSANILVHHHRHHLLLIILFTNLIFSCNPSSATAIIGRNKENLGTPFIFPGDPEGWKKVWAWKSCGGSGGLF